MKFIARITILLLFISGSAVAQDGWVRDYETAQKLSIATDKPMLVEFWATWCRPCIKMDNEVWGNNDVKELLKNYVPVKVNLDMNKSLARQFQVKAIPYYFITDAHGNILFKQLGFSNKFPVEAALEKYKLNFSYMKQPLANYFKNKNYVSAIRLTQKYLDFSLFLDKNVRIDVLAIAENYLKEASKLLKRDQSNYAIMKQKIELLELNIDLYRERFHKVEKQLENRIAEENLSESNEVLFAYLNYCLSCNDQRANDKTKWENKISEFTNAEIYLDRASQFLEGN